METYYTVYKVTNKINGKFYIGTHKTKNLNDDYMGSGTYLKRSIEKNGLENFIKEIIFVYDNPEEMFAKESEIVNIDFLSEENTYNLKIGGKGGWCYVNIDNDLRLEKNRKAMKIATKNGILIKAQKRLKELYKNKEWVRKKHSGLGKNFGSGFLGKFHLEETKQQIGFANSIKQSGKNNSQYGTMWITNGIESKKVKKEEVIPSGWNKGRTV